MPGPAPPTVSEPIGFANGGFRPLPRSLERSRTRASRGTEAGIAQQRSLWRALEWGPDPQLPPGAEGAKNQWGGDRGRAMYTQSQSPTGSHCRHHRAPIIRPRLREPRQWLRALARGPPPASSPQEERGRRHHAATSGGTLEKTPLFFRAGDSPSRPPLRAHPREIHSQPGAPCPSRRAATVSRRLRTGAHLVDLEHSPPDLELLCVLIPARKPMACSAGMIGVSIPRDRV